MAPTTSKEKKGGLRQVQDALLMPFDQMAIAAGAIPRSKVPNMFKTKKKGYHKKEEDKSKSTLDTAFQKRVDQARAGAHRLQVVFAAPLQMDMGYKPPSYQKTTKEQQFIDQALEHGFIFSNLKGSERHALIMAFEPFNVPKGDKIIQQNDEGDYFYLIETGTVDFVVNGKHVGNASSGRGFGELALLYDSPRAATCLAETECKLWRIDQKTFRRVIAKYNLSEDEETQSLLRKVPFLQGFDDKVLGKIAAALITQTFEKGQVIVRRGEEATHFYIIKEGHIQASDIQVGDNKYDDTVLGPGEFFGEGAILHHDTNRGTGTAMDKVTCLCLSKHIFTKTLGGLEKMMLRTEDMKKLKVVPLKNRPELKTEEREALSSLIKTHRFTKGYVFFEEGKKRTPKLCFVRRGTVTIKSEYRNAKMLREVLGQDAGSGQEKETLTITKGGFFGNDTIVPDEDGHFHCENYTAYAEEDCVIGILDIHSIMSVLGKKQGEADIPFETLQMHRILGAGTFGKVWLTSIKGATSSGNKTETYALKVQNKRKLVAYNQASGVIQERNVMAKLDSEFIIKLVASYQDDKNVYMLLKLYQGGELYNIMHTDNRDGLPEFAAKFYSAAVLEGLSYMHHRHIIYRDLKPENVLLNSDGYTVIVDLGFARVVKGKTYTFCGTPMYIAPEVITQRGHDKGYDHWSWAVMLYEMIVGVTPFYEEGMGQMDLFSRIAKAEYEFPPGDFMSRESKDLISRVLVTRPSERLGSLANDDVDIRNHEWYEDMDWEKLQNKELEAPWVPELTDPLDVSNFDNWEHLEKEAAKEAKEKPLSAAEQQIFKDF